MKRSSQIRWLILALALPLASCKSELYSGLNEREANEIVATLTEASIPAARDGNKEGAFSVDVEGSMMSDATRVLSMHGLPRPKFETLGKIFESGGMVATPFEERAKFMYALDQELSHSISQIAGVASARVHIMIPDGSPLDLKKERPRASVFIYVNPDADVSKQISTIKTLILNSVNNLAYEDIAVACFPASNMDTIKSAAASPARTDYSLAGGGALLASILVFFALRPRQKGRAASAKILLSPQRRSS